MVGPAKLTMGMFWLNPDCYLALDEKNTSYFASAGITTKVALKQNTGNANSSGLNLSLLTHATHDKPSD